ncbi:type I polyketide synthase [Bacillus swezeyi]|uniref:SDR family NAD(P)-dependent oxidoreductase n=2 Tax=Bacillus TaxID=1386 RepID=A0A5M8RJU6_9BACI|nr:type I polyketide synthase [Bacillus swezeyi]KAA6447680.1 SDR family NAD(P)-dependent oxidoreductase [Bacillus swezeyi]KAA6473944.1 SDR family NAD(P)-dependent oxidoreductase [Bacillus swezeyi]TYS34263.1 SDR family NAD(P)-dependent oxidoreductase [Bacillus swezeyi]
MSKTTGLEIAVIGMACRFPGAKNIGEFWQNIRNGTESITFFTKEELLEAGVGEDVLHHEDYVRAKGKVEQHDHFDAEFFGYSQREAEVMDPQIRMFHEVAWESLENAGYNPETYPDPIGLFGAASANLHWQAGSMLMRNNSSSEQFAAIQLTDKDFMNTQVSYKLNLTGPSVAVDTACSSSLTAVHLAARSLLTGDCKMALAGGVTITCPHKKGYMYQEGMIMSPDGRCRAFDADAKGTVGGEGCGVVVLKTLKQAVKDRDHIYAVIKGSAYNNDGSGKVGFTAPSIDGQAAVIKKALKLGKVDPESISYIEAHGTGTSLGDPVEVEALKQAFQTNKRQYCGIGSVKTNIGHLDSAAGIAGFIKTALSLYAKTLPPSLHYQKPNPKIDFENSPFYVNTTAKKWTKPDQVLRAGVSSFGIGGTNVHVVMEEPPDDKRLSGTSAGDQLMILSARSEEAVSQSAERLKRFLKENEQVPLEHISYTLQAGRKHFRYRQAFTASPLGITSTDSKPTLSFKQPAVVFMFSGQGSQYVNMGKELYEKEPVFQRELNRCFSILKRAGDISLKEIMYPDNEKEAEKARRLIGQTLYTQTALFSFEYALASLLMSKGVKAHYMIGHSIGEITAACLAGVCSLEDALYMVRMRGRLMQKMPEGEMLSVALSSADLEKELIEGIELSAFNSSNLSVVSGLQEDIDMFASRLQAKGIAVQRLKTSHAFHSSMMQPAALTFAEKLANIELKRPSCPFVSNITGTWIKDDQAADPDYWAAHIRSKVDFDSGLDTLFRLGEAVFIEIGPGNSLCQFVRKHKGFTDRHTAVNIVRHPKEASSDHVYFLNGIGRLWKYGVHLNWGMFHGDRPYKRVPLPTYPFEHKVFADPEFFTDKLEERVKSHFKSSGKAAGHLPFEQWFYIPVWERAEPTVRQRTHQGKKVLVFEQNGHLSEYLKQQHAEVVTVTPGQNFFETERNKFTADHLQTSHLKQFMHEMKNRGFIPDDIVCMWMPNEDNDSDEEVLESYLPLLDIVRITGTESRPMNITVITNQGHDVTGAETLQPGQAALTGVCLTIPQEYKHIRCRNIDLCLDQDDVDDGDWPLFISYELTKEDDEPVVAYRGKSRWVRRAKQVIKPDDAPLDSKLKQNGVYLITGGLGGMGLTLATHLAEKVQAKLVLISRTPVPKRELWPQAAAEETAQAAKIQKLRELEKLGAELLILQADVSEEAELQKALQEAADRFGSDINGVIHSAGTADGKVIQARTSADERDMIKAKITGTTVLRKALQNRTTDFFMLCSSLVSFLGAGGQVGYAASNSFLDSFAYACRKEGDNMIAVNWDRWNQVGMSFESEAGAVLSQLPENRQHQQPGMTPSQGAEAFMKALHLEYPQVLISVNELNKRIESSIQRTDEKQEQPFEKRDLDDLEEKLNATFSEFFDSQDIDVNMNFFELGASSLDLLQVSSKIQSQLGLDIPVVMMYSHPTVASLVRAVKSQNGFVEEKESGKELDRKRAINEGKNRRKQRIRRK